MSEPNPTPPPFEGGRCRPVAVLGGIRIPFCRANTAYAELGNLELATRTLGSLVERFGLHGEVLGEVAAGAVLKHSRDWNLAREAVLGSGLSPLTPGLTLARACGTSLDAALVVAAKIATGQIEAGVALGSDTTSDVPIVLSEPLRRRLLAVYRARGALAKLRALLRGFRLRELKPAFPGVAEPRTGLSMGQHAERMAREWGIGREAQDRLALASHRKAHAAYERGFFADLVEPFRGLSRDAILRPDTTLEKLAALRPAFDPERGTLTAGNSTPLTDGAAAVLLASEDWARARGLPVRAWLTAARVAAVDFVGGEGLLMAPCYAVARLLRERGLSFADFDFFEIHEAFAAQVLCTLAAFRDERYCRERLGLDGPLGEIPEERLNVVGSSLAFGHPFAATGARILATLAKLLDERGRGRGLVSVCTAGGMGVAAILER
ncbi:MAG: acetyl-CoA C-acetyltransferase [Xanthomonadales bacterium]|nr:acetyl-CoA C-acetyltransferase [Xanthomonadales bacterium]